MHSIHGQNSSQWTFDVAHPSDHETLTVQIIFTSKICKSANQSGSKQSHKFRQWSMGDALWEVVFLETSQFVVAWRQPVDFDSRIGFVNPTLCQEWAALPKTSHRKPIASRRLEAALHAHYAVLMRVQKPWNLNTKYQLTSLDVFSRLLLLLVWGGIVTVWYVWTYG